MALLLPSTFALHPATALIMLAGIYYGAMYGGSTTSILVNVPGEAGSVVTLLDGYQMTRKGRAGAALAIAAVGSFVAGTLGVVGIMLAASWLADLAVRFGPPEYFAIALGGLLLLSRLSGGSMFHAFVMVAIGLALGTVGMDSISALRRFTFGSVQLSQGVDLVPVIMGLYGVAEVLIARRGGRCARRSLGCACARCCPRGGVAAVGGADRARLGGRASSPGSSPAPPRCCRPSSPTRSRRSVSHTPERFGTGAVEGVAGPEAANNARHRGRDGAAALARHPVLAGHRHPARRPRHPRAPARAAPDQPAPRGLLGLRREHVHRQPPAADPEPAAGGLFVSVLRLPQHVLATLVLLLCLVGAFSLSNSFLDLWVLAIFGVFGYALRKLRVDPSPLVVALVLGPMMEKTLRQSLFLTRGSVVDLVSRPLTAAILIVPVAALLGPPTRHGRSTMRRSGLSPVRPGSPVVRMSCHGEPRLGRGRSWE